jgi:hypothetical protein
MMPKAAGIGAVRTSLQNLRKEMARSRYELRGTPLSTTPAPMTPKPTRYHRA